MNATTQGQPPEIRTFWVGPSLSLYERLSLASFVQAGAKVQLYTYDPDLVVPEGVERVDANEILPGSVHGFRGPTGHLSFALHSDLFRYAAIEKLGGWYADLDMICIGKSLPDVPIYIARETEKLVNGAVMKFPAGHPFVATAIREAQSLLPKTSTSTGAAARILIGPTLVTQLIERLEMDSMVRPRSVAYEIGTDEVKAFFDPASCERVQERLAESDFTHLWSGHWALFPKIYGPPKGSYLDRLFSRAGIAVPERGRLAYSTVLDWFRGQRVVVTCKSLLQEDRLPPDVVERLFKLEPQSPQIARTARSTPPLAAANKPQVVQTFWQGGALSPYQRLCLRSFVDRGHQVELFTYNSRLRLPSWIERRSAAEILPQDRILKSSREGNAINSNLFRYALLHKRGGWWIDPDIVLLQPELPADDLFFAGLNGFGLTSTSLLRFPKGHEIMKTALSKALELGDAVENWQSTRGPLLTEVIRTSDASALLDDRETLGPVSWFDVLALFDPSCLEDLEDRCRSALALQLHLDVWRRAGIPQRLGPTRGSLLEELFQRHDVSASFGEEMSFDEVRRWTGNMYARVGRRQIRTN